MQENQILSEIEKIKARLDRIEQAVFGPQDAADHPRVNRDALEGIETETDPDRIAGRLSMAFEL